MAKEAYYFSHDCNARNDEKILAIRMRHGAEGYGIYFMLIERLREATDYTSVKDYNIIAFDLRVSAEKVKSIIEEFGLFGFTEDKKYFFSNSLNRRMDEADERRGKLSQAGKKGAAKRELNKQNKNNEQATLKPPLNNVEALKENKEKETKLKKEENINSEFPFEKIWELYERKGNKKTSERKWAKLPDITKQKIFAHIPKYVSSTPDKQYRKNFETYLNQEAWNDEVQMPIEKVKQNTQIGLIHQEEDFDMSRLFKN